MTFEQNDTIVALATAPGTGAIAVIRLSGPGAIKMVENYFYSRSLKKKSISQAKSHTILLGVLMHQQVVIDEVLIAVFRSPNSYTGQDSIEISCHGSRFIQQQILQLLLASGARMAQPGEFTMRAFFNRKLDLSQAEAVADLVASNSSVSHQVAMQQMRGGFSRQISVLRANLVNFASLIELELDFSEEDVEFADRSDLKKLISTITTVVERLIESFELGNVIKNGIPVAIVGKPNAGKSTLLNVLLEEERAIVSEIAGTTRDTIEDEITIEGVLFRFIDTAGLRSTSDVIERIGVDRAYEAMQKSAIVIYVFDAHELSCGDLSEEIKLLRPHLGNSQLLLVANKSDLEEEQALVAEFIDLPDMIFISAKENKGIDSLKKKLLQLFDLRAVNATETVVTNARHAQALKNASGSLKKVSEGLDSGIPGDLLALDIRHALEELGNITGEVTNEHLLENIFTRFCIGK
jgi:tRNA modification GTPase